MEVDGEEGEEDAAIDVDVEVDVDVVDNDGVVDAFTVEMAGEDEDCDDT